MTGPARPLQHSASVTIRKRRAAISKPRSAKLVALVGEAPDWQLELQTLLGKEGYGTDRVSQLDAVLPMLATGALQALFLPAGSLAATDLLVLQRIREISPRTAVVVVTKTPTDPDLKRALESGATAFLSWPASSSAVRQAIHRERVMVSAAYHP